MAGTKWSYAQNNLRIGELVTQDAHHRVPTRIHLEEGDEVGRRLADQRQYGLVLSILRAHIQ